MKKRCAIIGMVNTIYCPFEVNDNQELSKHFNTVELYFLKKNIQIFFMFKMEAGIILI